MGRRMCHLALALMVSGSLLANLPTLASARRSGSPSRQQAGPSFVFPSDGTILPYNSTLTFQVQPVGGATGYLWSFVQNGGIVWQNLDSDGSLSSNTYTMKPGGRAHNSVRPGPLQVRVRAQLGGNRWTAAGVITVRLQGKGTPTKPKSGPPTPGTVLYQADTSGGFDKWAGSADWRHLNGMLINDGTNNSSSIMSPYNTKNVNDYAVEVEMRIVQRPCGNGFGIRVREGQDETTGYSFNIEASDGLNCPMSASIQAANSNLGEKGISLDTNWHTYCIEVKGDTIQVRVDNAVVISVADNRYLNGGGISLFDGDRYHNGGVQLNVRSFKVIAL